MAGWEDETEDLDETPEEYLQGELSEEYLQEDFSEGIALEEIPEVTWAKEIAQIEDPEIRAKEIEVAERILEKEEALKQKLESGEITTSDYLNEYQFKLGREKLKASTRCSFESVGLTWDHFGDLAEDYDLKIRDLHLPEDQSLLRMKERVKKTIDRIGPDAAQELADRMHEKEELNDEAHELISRQTRLRRKR